MIRNEIDRVNKFYYLYIYVYVYIIKYLVM